MGINTANNRYRMVSRNILKQQILSLTINTIGGFASSIFLGIYRFLLRDNPWLLAINPPLKDLNGNIYSSLLSRINSGLHVGSIKPSIKDRVIVSNILVVIFTLLVTSSVIGFIVWLLVGGNLLFIFEVMIPSMIIISIILYPFTSYSSIFLYVKGYEPESLMIPVILMISDILTTPTLIGYTLLLVIVGEVAKHFLFILIFSFSVVIGYLVFKRGVTGVFRIVRESQSVLMICLFLDIGAGVYLARSVDLLVSYPFIIISAPVFNGLMGSLTSIYATRQNVLYHIGLTSLKPDKTKIQYLPYMFILSIYSGTMLSLIGYSLTILITHGNILPLQTCILISVTSSIVITPILWLLIQVFSYISFKIGFDPDNVMAPILTSMIDFVGTITYIYTANTLISYLI